MAVLLEASLTILLLGWHIVCDVCVVALLREPDHDKDDDDGDDDDSHAGDDDVNERPVLTSDPVVPNRLLNLMRII